VGRGLSAAAPTDGHCLGVILAESAIYASNNQVCPLTPLAEELGTNRGSVADIFLPDWFSRRIPLFGGTALLLGVVLNLRARARHDPARQEDERNDRW
jgi:hypothetical protein